MDDISLELYLSVTQRLTSYTRLQALAAAVLGIERMWQIFQDWTQQESIPYLRCSPRTFREPYRRALDLLWEQVESGEIYNKHRDVFNALYEFTETSYDEEVALDVDFGNARLFVDELVSGGIAGFFPLRPERQNLPPWNAPDFYESCAARFVTLYAEQLSQFLYDQYAAQSSGKTTDAEICALIGRDPLWLAETARIDSDLRLVQDYPANQKAVAQRLEKNRMLRTQPFCAEESLHSR